MAGTSRFQLFVLLLSVTVWVSFADSSDAKTCRDETCQANDSIDCLSEVVLFEGVPNVLSDGETQRRVSTLLDEKPARFPKVARFTEIFASLNFDRDKRLFHISANGDHEGWFVFVPSEECFIVAKRLIAREIVALLGDEVSEQVKQVDLRGPHELVDETGKFYPDATTSQRLHLLLPRESFVHESVREGFVRTLSDGTKLKTLSMVPRVFVIDPIIPLELCEELIEISSDNFRRSPEKHYAPGFENYRTSLTGSTPFDSVAAQTLFQRVHEITAMPEGGVERPQLLKYETGTSWYKEHLDYYHNFEPRPVEEVRLFVRLRALELLRLNVTDMMEVLNNGDDDPLQRFDHPDRTLRGTIVSKMVEKLDLPIPDGVTVRRVLHNYMVDASDPVATFEEVAIVFATLLLESNGASEPQSLAETYFRLQDPSHEGIQDYVPYCLKQVQFNRHATVLPILRAAEQGGYTAFPLSKSSLGIDPDPDEDIEECKQGLIVHPQAGQALMFYNRSPRGDLDPMSYHAGCPPKVGEKFAANCFTWDSDQHWAWKFITDVSDLYDRP